ncbi:nadh:flavin oxidoreductase [Stylonychia lemnae]|uniref:Nadh:flavin oxidoreductase n=1 Tax=Stylonychia lemnae TaxID=5949 RepID=A0A078AY42_STYLE|nr:nadh:flavin oxidoreductase [Stylonychia lemnae]|eukprot:CDW86132.1 nadh:flavin oxidoreductase [Stylonychia lemnae]
MGCTSSNPQQPKSLNNKTPALFTSYKMGDVVLQNRIVMAALTRCRTNPADKIPNNLLVEYYSARADAGFILTECTSCRVDGDCFPGSAGIYSDAQVEGWKKVTKAVHDKGGKIYLQIWHAGRSAHPSQIGGVTPLSSSPVALNESVYTMNGKEQLVVPKEATIAEIQELIKAFRHGAENAKKAGFDGIELHAGHGYIVDQFLRDCVNKRTDDYGGSIQNRCRLTLEILDQLVAVFGKGRVGMKISPLNEYNGMSDSNPFELFTYLLEQASKKGIAFVEVNEGISFDAADHATKLVKHLANQTKKTVREILKPHFKGTYISNFKHEYDSATQVIQEGKAELVSFGTHFVCNNDLVQRFKNGTPLRGLQNVKDMSKLQAVYFYGNTALGYTDLSPYEA